MQIISSLLFWIVYFSSKGDYSFTIKFEGFGETKEKTFSIRVGILDFYILNFPTFAIKNYAQTFQLTRYADLDQALELAVDFQDGQETVTFQAAENYTTLTYTYTTTGEKECSAEMTYNGITEVAVYKVTVSKGCVSTPDLFQVEHRIPSNPMGVLISHIPTMAGRAVRGEECLETEQLVYRWELWKDIGSPPSHSWEAVDIQQPEANSLVLSKYILEPGLHRVWLEVSVTGSVERVSDTIHISVNLPAIVAEISGCGSIKEAAIGQAHVLDAEASSYDPAHDALARSPIGPSILSYTWTCYKLDSEDLVPRYTARFNRDISYRSQPRCLGIEFDPMQGAITVMLVSADFDGYLALFEVFARSNIGDRNSTAVTVLKMISGDRPSVTIK